MHTCTALRRRGGGEGVSNSKRMSLQAEFVINGSRSAGGKSNLWCHIRGIPHIKSLQLVSLDLLYLGSRITYVESLAHVSDPGGNRGTVLQEREIGLFTTRFFVGSAVVAIATSLSPTSVKVNCRGAKT